MPFSPRRGVSKIMPVKRWIDGRMNRRLLPRIDQYLVADQMQTITPVYQDANISETDPASKAAGKASPAIRTGSDSITGHTDIFGPM